MNFINAKFKSKCAETGATISKGENCLYDIAYGKVYCTFSRKYLVQKEADGTSSFMEAQENAYFDNFCLANNI
jgi:hypothetical protein